MLDAKLIVVGGDAKASEIQLRLPTVIGRGREVSLTLPHPLVSRRHTEIFERDGRLMVRDLGSLNGTFVNNQRIEGEQVLEPNQLLTLGNVTFRAIYKVEGELAVEESQQRSEVPLSEAVAPARQNIDTEPLSEPGTADSKDSSAARDSTIEETRQPVVSERLSRQPASSGLDLNLVVDGQSPVASTIDPADLQFGEVDAQSAIDPQQSDLGSFLKKLPR